MTEQEWLTSTDPKRMLAFRQGPAQWRKRLLYGCACCRLIWPLLTDETFRQAVAVCERHADGLADEGELKSSYGRVSAASRKAWDERQVRGKELVDSFHRGAVRWDEPVYRRYHQAEVAVHVTTALWCLVNTESVGRVAASASHAWRLAAWQSPAARKAATCWTRVARAGMLRDIFGNPFRRAPRVRHWRTPDVLSLGQAAYTERILPSGHLDPARLGILADALEDAGCSDEGILAHLRSAGPHVRGCRAVDLILAKE